jgi:predicted 3-demethylubiquinone-9 3-methyltransferase (glyoxalase superfamily)
MQKIVPHLWFDTQAKEAAEFYVSAFPDSKITNTTLLRNTPSGDADMVTFSLTGYDFMAISAGPLFKFNPAISFMVNFDPSQDPDAKANLDALWEKLSNGGIALMPLDKYPFSEHYGWIQDKFGVTWQLMLTNPAGEPKPFIIPSIMFIGDGYGKAEEATDFYLSVFKNSKRGTMAKYGAQQPPDKEGTVMFTDFQLEGQWFAAMDSAQNHKFQLNEAISLMVNCQDQEEADYYWEKLSAVPESEQCGWLKDKYGLSWQIVPSNIGELMMNPEKSQRVMDVVMKMKKLDMEKMTNA